MRSHVDEMKITYNTRCAEPDGLVATIGFFDGVHRGHRFLLGELQRMAKERQLPSAVITFSCHPQSVLQPGFLSNLLNTPEEKSEQLGSTGVDCCVVLDFTPQLAHLSAREFIVDVLKERLNVKVLLIGYDHRFGNGRAKGFDDYVAYGAACGVEVLEASPYNEGSVPVSSSVIRDYLLAGDVSAAFRLLSYPYSLTGHVVGGHKMGRKLGFPTANIVADHPDKIIPCIGVYAVWVYVESVRYKGMLYIGNRPTLENGVNITMEVNILDFDRNIYNNKLTVAFISYIRGGFRFSSLEKLKEQLLKDRETVSAVLKE